MAKAKKTATTTKTLDTLAADVRAAALALWAAEDSLDTVDAGADMRAAIADAHYRTAHTAYTWARERYVMLARIEERAKADAATVELGMSLDDIDGIACDGLTEVRCDYAALNVDVVTEVYLDAFEGAVDYEAILGH